MDEPNGAPPRRVRLSLPTATESQGITLTANSYSNPPTGEVDPQVPLTHVMLARDDTARHLAWALLRQAILSRALLITVGVELVVAVLLATVFHSPGTALFLLFMAVVTPLAVAYRCWRGAAAIAPAGFTLGVGLGPQHLAIRHAVATSTTSYSAWKAANQVRDVVVLKTKRGGVVPLPAELFGADLPRLQELIAHAEETPPPPSTGPDLPFQFVCTAHTRGRMLRVLLLPTARGVGVVALAALLVGAGLSILPSSRRASSLALGWPSLAWLVFTVVVVTVLLAGLTALLLWRRLAASTRPGTTIRAGASDAALVVEDATGRVTIPFQGIRKVTTTRHVVLIRSALRSQFALPRELLPDAEITRIRAAVEWFRSRR